MFHCHILEHEDNGMMGQIKSNKIIYIVAIILSSPNILGMRLGH